MNNIISSETFKYICYTAIFISLVLPYIFHILNIFNITDIKSIFPGEKKYGRISSRGYPFKDKNGNFLYRFNLTELLIGGTAIALLLINLYYEVYYK
jgi:hypothetical protein